MALVLDLADGAQHAQAAPAETVVSLTQARLSYPSPEGEVSVLRGIDIQLAAGEITAVTGPSGSGKSSLIAVIGGLEKATGGDVDVLGVDLNQASESVRTNLRRRDIGIVFQSFHLIPAMTAVQNAALPMVLAGETEAETAAARMLDRVGLGHRLTHRPSALSGGEQQRVAIARAFAGSPELLFADEPTGNLDAQTGERVAEVLFDLRSRNGTALVLVTHDPQVADRCDRRYRLVEGRLELTA